MRRCIDCNAVLRPGRTYRACGPCFMLAAHKFEGLIAGVMVPTLSSTPDMIRAFAKAADVEDLNTTLGQIRGVLTFDPVLDGPVLAPREETT